MLLKNVTKAHSLKKYVGLKIIRSKPGKCLKKQTVRFEHRVILHFTNSSIAIFAAWNPQHCIKNCLSF